MYRTAAVLLLLPVLLSTLWFLPASKAAMPAAEPDIDFFAVNHPGDEPDAVVGDGKCETTGGLCTFRAALMEANASANWSFIGIDNPGTVNLTGPLPPITAKLSIRGSFFENFTLRRQSGGDYRILTITTSAAVDISNLTIENGKTPDGPPTDITGGGQAEAGGGILNMNAPLKLQGVNIIGNRTGNGGNATGTNSFGGWGGHGGGIASFAPLTMLRCRVEDNVTGSGGGGPFGGAGGRGGGIFLASQATLTDVVVDGNTTGDGATGTNSGLSAGNSGYGGGIFIDAGATLTNLTVTNNITGNVVRGSAGDGGGLYLSAGMTTLVNSTVSNNRTGNASGLFASSGYGGGIANEAQAKISGTTISGNVTGSNGENGTGGGGAGIRNTGVIDLFNSTISGNSIGASDSQGLSNAGGGISNWFIITITNSTITANSAFANNIAGVAGNFSDNQTTTIRNTIIAQNGSADSPEVNGTFVSQGNNMIGNGDGATGFIDSDLVGTIASPINALLGPLADNGGPSLTHALLAGSPALEAGNNALAKDSNNNPLASDQRGTSRITDSAGDADSIATVDIGAYEFHQTLDNIPDQTTNEDVAITISFAIGDAGPAATSVTASSNNQTILADSNLTLTGTGNVRSLEIQPNPDQFGMVTITVTVNLTGGGSVSDSFVVSIAPINDRPRFAVGSSQQVLEDAGPQTIANWATFIDSGIDDGPQALNFVVTNDNPSLFAVAPAVSTSGTLTYTAAANRSGSATVAVVLKDDGGTANGGEDTSFPQTFVINVVAINDIPSFTKGPDQTIVEDAGFQNLIWATGISPGPLESDQSVQFIVTNNTNSALFSVQPSVNSAGVLSYMPAANANGIADITLIGKDTGGTANGGIDTTAPQTFRITVTAVNDPPFHSVPFNPQTNQQTALIFSTISITDVDAGADPIRVSLTVTQGTLSLPSHAGLTFVAGDGIDDATMTFTGTVAAINSALNGLTFRPNTGFSGTATLQIVSEDDGHNGAGGPKTTTSNLNITVRAGGRLAFNTGVFGVNETGGTATVTVLRAGGTAGTATVNYSTSNGTATAGASCSSGVDYLPASGTLTWNNGDSSSRTFTITICNDGANEDDETINLTLTNAAGTGSLGTQPTATLTIGNDDAPVLLTEEGTQHAIALDLVNHTRDPFSLLNPFNLSTDQRRRVSLFVWHLGLLPGDTVASVTVTARDDEGRTYNLPVESLTPTTEVADVTQVVVRLPDSVIGAPRDLLVKVTLRGPGTNEGSIRIAP